MNIESLDVNDGLDDFKPSDKILLVDADTLVYLACLQCEEKDDLLPREYYSDSEWSEIESNPGFSESEHAIYQCDFDVLLSVAEERISELKSLTNTVRIELWFSSGKTFRHELTSTYKANRKDIRYPFGLEWLKSELSEKYDGGICDGYEADDIVVFKKLRDRDKYILAAVDKDVLNSVPGKHLNYYKSFQYSIEPKFVETSAEFAIRWPYIQCMAGDTSDNVKGIPGIGIKRAEKILGDSILEIELWSKTLEAYKKKNLSEDEAILNMRLVNMHQLKEIDDKLMIVFWEPPKL